MIIKVEKIEAEVIRKDIRRINMRVYPDGKIIISAPKRATNTEIESFFREKLEWIRKTRTLLSEKRKHSLLYHPEKDRTVFLFGEEFEIETDFSLSPCVYKGNQKITVGTNGLSDGQKEEMLDAFFKEELEKILSVSVPKWENITNLKASSWNIKKIKSYWGKCLTQTQEIIFNQRLVHYPKECIEYVVLHELSHIKYPNHQKEFKAFLSMYMPDWKRRNDVLKQTGSVS